MCTIDFYTILIDADNGNVVFHGKFTWKDVMMYILLYAVCEMNVGSRAEFERISFWPNFYQDGSCLCCLTRNHRKT